MSGVTPSAISSEISTAAQRVNASAAKNCPATPDSNDSGAKTTTVVNVEFATGQAISFSASAVADQLSIPAATRRCTASTTTTASSTTSPIATAKPPKDIRFMDEPARCITADVISMVDGS